MEDQHYQKQTLWVYKMELETVIESRRSIRYYIDKEIDKRDIEKILESGILAPSAKNRQPWHFIIIKSDKDLKSKISDLLEENLPEASLTSEVIRTCDTIIMIYADIEHTILDVQSVGACIENMILKATDLNISTLWIGYTLQIEEELKELLDTDKTLIATLALGYSETKPKPRPRKPLEEVSTWK